MDDPSLTGEKSLKLLRTNIPPQCSRPPFPAVAFDLPTTGDLNAQVECNRNFTTDSCIATISSDRGEVNHDNRTRYKR